MERPLDQTKNWRGTEVLGTRDKYTGLKHNPFVIDYPESDEEFEEVEEVIEEGSGKRRGRPLKKGGVLVGGNNDKKFTYIEFVKHYRNAHPNLTWKEALIAAKPDYYREVGKKEEKPRAYVKKQSLSNVVLRSKEPRTPLDKSNVALRFVEPRTPQNSPTKEKRLMNKSMEKEVGKAIGAALAAGTHAIVPIEMVKKVPKSRVIKSVGKSKVKQDVIPEQKHKKAGRPRKQK